MPRRTPNIYPVTLKDGSKRYRVMLTFRDTDTRERVQKMVTFRTEKEAKDALAENRANATRGDDAPPADMTLAELCTEWLRAHSARLKPTSVARYREQLEREILPALGHLRLQQITARRIEAHYAQMRDGGRSEWVIGNVHSRIRQVLGYACRTKILRINEAANVTRPRGQRREMHCWNDVEIARFLAHADASKFGPIWLVALHTGMRRGELLGLRWADVDFERNRLRVMQNRARMRSNHFVTQTTKGGRSRTLDVIPEVIVALRTHRAQQNQWRLARANWPGEDRVFTTRLGTTPDVHDLHADLRRVQTVAGVPQIRTHDLRHTHATYLLRHNTPIKEVSQRLGHASTSMTLNVYAHALEEDHQATVRLLARMASGPR